MPIGGHRYRDALVGNTLAGHTLTDNTPAMSRNQSAASTALQLDEASAILRSSVTNGTTNNRDTTGNTVTLEDTAAEEHQGEMEIDELDENDEGDEGDEGDDLAEPTSNLSLASDGAVQAGSNPRRKQAVTVGTKAALVEPGDDASRAGGVPRSDVEFLPPYLYRVVYGECSIAFSENTGEHGAHPRIAIAARGMGKHPAVRSGFPFLEREAVRKHLQRTVEEAQQKQCMPTPYISLFSSYRSAMAFAEELFKMGIGLGRDRPLQLCAISTKGFVYASGTTARVCAHTGKGKAPYELNADERMPVFVGSRERYEQGKNWADFYFSVEDAQKHLRLPDSVGQKGDWVAVNYIDNDSVAYVHSVRAKRSRQGKCP